MKKYTDTAKRRKRLCASALTGLCALWLAACASGEAAPAESAAETATAESEISAPGTASEYTGKLIINELMVKNRATLEDENGAFPDWIELKNASKEPISLKDFTLSDGEDKDGWTLPDITLSAGEYAVIYADGGDEGAHAGFSLSLDETVYLRDLTGAIADTAECTSDKADTALALNAAGEWEKTRFATPGYENSMAGYAARQESLTRKAGLEIVEAVTANAGTLEQSELGLCDWVEIKNTVDTAIALGDYYLSDDDDILKMWAFPDETLAPGESVIIICSSDEGEADEGYYRAPFDLSASAECLYISNSAGEITDYAYLHDIPAGGSMGRMAGEGGWVYFAAPQPRQEKTGGARYVTASPECVVPDGVYNDAASVALELVSESADTAIYYTLDSTRPNESSTLYTGLISLDKTTVVRAVAVAPGALPSEVETFTFIINENHSLPVVSLVGDDPEELQRMYAAGRKGTEVGGHIAYYTADGGFSAPCGVDMHGETSLALPKKNMGIHFRSRYGEDKVKYDVFGGGVTEFKSFVLRAGQDQTRSIIRSELLENLCLQFSDNVPTQRSEYCVLYVNGEYNGIYALMEKVNEAHYAALMGVTKESVSVVKAPVKPGSEFYESVIRFAMNNDLTTPTAYAEFCEVLDIDSLIDWMIIEGYSANTDIASGNIRFARSTEGDGKWRLMLYDMDATLTESGSIFTNVLKPESTQCAVFITQLVNNPDFREKFLTRAGEVLSTTLSNENVDAETVRLAGLIESEVERDSAVRITTTKAQWARAVDDVRANITERDWSGRSIQAIGKLMKLSAEEMQKYFNK